jgi:hypothetical protein
VGASARAWLGEGSGSVIVANVFQNSVYLRTSSADLVNLTRKAVRGPVNVNLESSEPSFQELLRVGDGASVALGFLQVGPLAVDLDGETFSNSFRRENVKGDLAKLVGVKLPAACSLLRALDLKESILDDEGKAYQRYRAFFRQAFVAQEGFDGAEFVARAKGLLGLGSGFTPSFDDFLAGFLCTFNSGAALSGQRELLVDVGEAESRSGWASARLLDYMQRGLMDEDIESVVSTFYSGRGDPFLLSLEDVVSRGHSSGLDMAVGVLMACSTILDLSEHGSLAAKTALSLGF